MTHPSSLDLEAFACGETAASVERHLGECASCSGFVERLRVALATAPSPARAAAAVARAASRDGVPTATPRSSAREAARRRWFFAASTIVVPLAAAAALVVFIRTPGTHESSSLVTAPTVPITSPASEPETTFKGEVQAAVIRERAGQQARFLGRVDVKPGDRFRVEVALDQEQAILAAVMGDDGSWLELMAEGVRRPGTHFSDRSARVDASPLSGTILVGSPEALARARSSRRFEGVTSIRIQWEAP